jgi:hypothetical protein
MRVGNFSLWIPQGTERDSGHVEMRHNTVYSLRIGNNNHSQRCDATVTVDGKEIGCFRIDAGRTITLERPSHDPGCFTFFETDSQQAQSAGVGSIANVDRGLVQVVFRPERKRYEREEKTSGGVTKDISHLDLEFCSRGDVADSGSVTCDYDSGITGLTGKSSQTFYNVPNLDYEPNAEVTISLRLVCGSGVRELKPSPRSNPVSAAVN